MYEKWQKILEGYYRKIYKGIKISPWHHYQLNVIEAEMEQLDSEMYKDEFQEDLTYQKEMKIKSSVSNTRFDSKYSHN